MAEKRQAEDEFDQRMASCLEEAGWSVEPSADGTYSLDGQSDAESRAFGEALTVCGDAIGDRERPSRGEVSIWYEHALDTAACLEDAGYELTTPVPSEDAYIDAVLERSPEVWIPFQDVIDTVEFTDVAEYMALYERCPQDGPSATLSF